MTRTVLAHLPQEIEHLHPKGTIIVVVKPLYGLAEAGTHWWATYFEHHKEKLQMETSTYDPCLLITHKDQSRFRIVGIQTNDIIILSNKEFAELKEKELIFTTKPREELGTDRPLVFNGSILAKDKNSLTVK